jgi:hypothetical protein
VANYLLRILEIKIQKLLNLNQLREYGCSKITVVTLFNKIFQNYFLYFIHMVKDYNLVLSITSIPFRASFSTITVLYSGHSVS